MSTAATMTGFNKESFQAFLARRDEPAWVRSQREAAFRAFEELPSPARDSEDWRRTDIRLLRLDKFAPAGEGVDTAIVAESRLNKGVTLAGRFTTHNSQRREFELDPAIAAQGVIFTSLDEAVRTHGDLIQGKLFSELHPEHDKFAALHAACWSGGLFLYVPARTRVEAPLHAFHQLSQGGVDFNHTLVVLEEGAEATLLSETGGDDSSAFHNGGLELLLGPRATLRYKSLQNWGSGTWHLARQVAALREGAKLQWTIGALGSRLAKVDQHVHLRGVDAEAQVNGVLFTEGKQHLSYHTLQHHEAPRCHSDLLYKGALQDESRVVWRGMIKVDRDAQKTDAYQRNDSLILSDHARTDSIPGLEIEADDVRCTHGATAGRVDDEMIFYAQSRGFTRKEAVRMIVTGFFQQVFDRISIESVREALAEAISRKIREFR